MESVKLMQVVVSKFFYNLNAADYIQIAILCALVWYSIETHLLKNWQKKLVQAQIFAMELERIRKNAESHGLRAPSINGFPIILRKIYELGCFDLKELYSPAHHQPLSRWAKIATWLESVSGANK